MIAPAPTGDLSVPFQSTPLTVLGWGATREGGPNTDGPLTQMVGAFSHQKYNVLGLKE